MTLGFAGRGFDMPDDGARPFDPGRLRLLATLGMLALLCLLGALLPVIGPANTLVIGALIVAPLVLVLPAERLVVVALAVAFFSRTLVAMGAPSLLNFLHYGFAIVALLKLLEMKTPRPTRGLELALIAFLGATVLSALINGWHLWRPLLVWLTFAEPFVFLGLVICLDGGARRRLQTWAIALALLQVPFVAVQFAAHGIGDQVQGTLINQGAGHHIMGAVTVVAGLLLLMREPKGALAPLRLLPALLLLALSVFSDAKQVYGAFALGLVLLTVLDFRRAPVMLAPAALGIVLFVIAAQFYPTLNQLTDGDMLDQYGDDKVETTSSIVDDMGWNGYYGLGPGNGLSRIALSTVEGYGNVPEFLLGDSTSRLAKRELSRYDPTLVSSAAASFYSWLGLYSDLGLLGVVSYVAAGVWVWLRLGASPPNERSLGRYLLASSIVLGFVFSWLEEPVYTVYVGVVIGACIRLPAPPAAPVPEGAVGAWTNLAPLRSTPGRPAIPIARLPGLEEAIADANG